jgi:hypothetical protein
MEKNKSNWWIDAVLLGLFWISFFPGLTSLALHEWLGVAAVLLAVLHLIMHWSWMETVTLKFFSHLSGQARMFYALDLVVMAGFVMILCTGLLISTWLDLPLYDMAAWTHIHLMVSVFTLVLVALKLVLHWRWITCAARRYVIDPVFSSTFAAGSSRTANPVSRRDFLIVSGLFGAATVLTIHSLFDEPQEVQAQSVQPTRSGRLSRARNPRWKRRRQRRCRPARHPSRRSPVSSSVPTTAPTPAAAGDMSIGMEIIYAITGSASRPTRFFYQYSMA